MRKTHFLRLTLSVGLFGAGSLLAACSDRTGVVEPAAATADAGSELVSASTTQATATIDFQVKVDNYSSSGDNGWITVNSACGGGGRIINAGKKNACTDRVQRREQLRVTFGAKNAPRMRISTFAGVSSSNGFSRNAIFAVPTSATFTVSADPTFDGVHVAAVLLDSNLRVVSGVVERRVPIGKRPF